MTDMESRCRLCGRKERQGTEKFKNIFDGEPGLSLDVKINKLLPIVVVKWDPLPHQICDTCLEKLSDMDKFYTETRNTDIFLKGLMSPKKRQTRELKKSDPMLKIPNLNNTYGNYLIRAIKNKSPDGDDDSSSLSDAEEIIPPPEPKKQPEPIVIDLEKEENEKLLIQKKLDDFMIHQIGHDPPAFIYSCKKCFKVLTAKHAAISHVCAAESPIKKPEEDEESWRRKTISLSTWSKGYHVCIICKSSFTRKSPLIKHLKQHHVRESADEADSEGGEEEEERDVRRKKKKHRRKEKKEKKVKKIKLKKLSRSDSSGVSERREAHGEDQFLEDEGNENNNTREEADKEKYKERYSSKPTRDCTTEKGPDIFKPIFKDMIVCTVCKEAFLSQKLLNDHQKTHHTNTAKEASASTLKKPTVDSLTNDEERPKEICLLCDKVFSDTASLKEHENYHLEMSVNVLKHSDQFKLPKRKRKEPVKNESEKTGVNENFNGNSLTTEELYICKTCNAPFNRKSSFNAHEMSHVDKSIYEFTDDEDQNIFKKRRKSNSGGRQ